MGELVAALNLPIGVLYTLVIGILCGVAMWFVARKYTIAENSINAFKKHEESDEEFHKEIKGSVRRVHERLTDQDDKLSGIQADVAEIKGFIQGTQSKQ